MKINLGCGKNLITGDGWLNIDKHPSTQNWENSNAAPLISAVDLRFRWPWLDESVELISVSHLLYALSAGEKRFLICEAARVLKPKGVIRITDDDNLHPASLYHIHKHHNSVERTSAAAIKSLMESAGLKTYWLDANTSLHPADRHLRQDLHKDGPAIFFIEGVKP